MNTQPGNGGDDATPLDVALATAEKGDAEAQAFYDAFLNARLYVPVPEDDEGKPADQVTLMVADVDGEGIVPVFDTVERLFNWAERELKFEVLAGHLLVKELDASLQIALNVGTKGFKLFVQQELDWVRERLKETLTELEAHDNSETVGFAETPPPDGVIGALAPAFERNQAVAAAFLVEANQRRPDKSHRWVLVLDVGDASEAVFEEAARDVGMAVRGALSSDEYMDILAFNPTDGTGRELVERGVTPIFVRLGNEVG